MCIKRKRRSILYSHECEILGLLALNLHLKTFKMYMESILCGDVLNKTAGMIIYHAWQNSDSILRC